MFFQGAVIGLSREEQLTNKRLSTDRPVTRTHRGEKNSFGYSPIQYLIIIIVIIIIAISE